MKSIKEKAEELVEKRVELSREESIAYFQGIEAGANYVLDVVECILEDNKLSDCEEICNELIALIEQLKK